MPQPSLALSVVERGWQEAREWSLAAAAARWRVVHLNRGWLSADVRALIVPQSGVRLWGAPRRLFRPVLWILLAWWGLCGRLALVVVDNERTFQRLAPALAVLRVRLLRIGQSAASYQFWEDAAARRPVAAPDEGNHAPGVDL